MKIRAPFVLVEDFSLRKYLCGRAGNRGTLLVAAVYVCILDLWIEPEYLRICDLLLEQEEI